MLGGVIARAFRWQKLLENGTYTCLDDLAWSVLIDALFVSRIVKLALLAPDIVDAILEGKQPANMTLGELMKPFPVEWAKQLSLFDITMNTRSGNDS